MKLDIFDVGHGACSLLTSPSGQRVMIDCASNARTGWQPGEHLRRIGAKSLDALVVTNYDEDHVRGIASVLDNFRVGQIRRNRSVSPRLIESLKSEDGMGAGIERLVDELECRSFLVDIWFGPDIPGLRMRQFWNPYPRFTDENNLSLVLHLKVGGVGVMFPGDLEEDGWLALMKRTDFRQALVETDLLIASHHGREDGCCEDIFEFCKPQFVVIADKPLVHETQKTDAFYRQFARGGMYGGAKRRVLTTRKDGTISLNLLKDIVPGRRVLVWF